MRILLIHQQFLEPDDGGGSRFNEMTRVWNEAGHEITVLAGMVHYATGKKRDRYKGKFTYPVEITPTLKVIRSHVSEAYNVNFLGRLWAYFSFVFSSIYAGLFKARGKYDVILVTSPPLFVGITAFVLAFFKRTPYVFEVRDLWPESAIDTGVLKNKILIRLAYWFEKIIYKRARLINVLTPAFRTKLIENKNVPEEKVVFIPNAADFSISDELLNGFDVNAFKKELNIENKFSIIYVGAHGVANHLIQVIETAELLKDSDPDVVFMLVGDGMQKPMLVEEAKKRGLTNIMFIDPVAKKEVFKYILASDAGASVLKRVDTFKTIYSNKTFDYMACKRPVLLAIDGVSRELVETAQCGLFIEPENPADFVRIIQKIKSDVELQKSMGENGYAYAKEHFDRDVLATRYLKYLDEAKK